ncbi:MAG: NAD(P)H-dependent oxidoreductase [Clostridia bacterium]|nr:NAD(P)H-dependent oxidoreductase [Clostridia bacterium]
MKVLVLNGSPAGDNSITLYTVKYIQKHFPDHEFEVLNVGQRIRACEKDFAPCKKALEEAELILFCYPVYTFLVPAQLHRFIELMKENGADVKGRIATQVTTSKHFYDVTAHRFIQENCADLGLNYVRGLSADMDDLTTERGRKEALDFFSFVLKSAERGWFEPSPLPVTVKKQPVVSAPTPPPAEDRRPGKVMIVGDFDAGSESDAPLRGLIESFRASLPMDSELVNIREFPFAGGCLGCFRCASTGKCVYKDGFDDYLRNNIQSADALVYAYTVKDHSMGCRFKLFDDRQFCNGHRTVTMGKPVGYLVSGDLDAEPNLRMLMESRAQVGGNFLAGIANSGADVARVAQVLTYAVAHHYLPPKDFYGVGGLKIFRDLIYQMQGLMREDHRFYKEHGFYDFPQKRKGRIVAMYAVGSLMGNEKLRKKAGDKMTEGMVMPYKKILEKY